MTPAALENALADLGHKFDRWSWEQCDAEFQRITPLLKAKEPSLDAANTDEVNSELRTVGSVIVELLSASFW